MKHLTPALLIAVLLLAIAPSAPAQRHAQAFAAGGKAQAGLADIRLTAPCYDEYSHHPVAAGGVGGWLQWRSAGGFSLRSEVSLQAPGAHLRWDDIDYRLREYMLGLRVGAQIDIPVPRTFTVIYLTAAPEIAATLGGTVHFLSDETGQVDMRLNASDARPVDLAVFVGFGVEFPVRSLILSAETGYRFGLANNFSGININDLNVLNRTASTWPATGERLRRGMEISIRAGIPFGQKVHIARERTPVLRQKAHCGE